MKKLTSIALISALACLLLSACRLTPSPRDPVTLTMWHNYGGDMQQTMDMLVDKFNSTEGKENGITIDVREISSSSELNNSLSMIVNGDPGAPDMPDIFTGYPKIAVQFAEKGILCDLDGYFSKKELANYVDAFVDEGRLPDGGLYVFPIAKSTEILYLNRTLFDRFAAETGADIAEFATFEGIARLSALYYRWTDSATPDIPNDGKTFYAADSWFNLAEVGMAQLGESLFATDNALRLNSAAYARIFSTVYDGASSGGMAIYNGYSSDLSKTGDLVCSTGSSAGILFYGDTVTYSNGVVENVQYDILPYPVFDGGQKLALQRGGGLMVAKSDEKREYAACLFIKWLTAAQQNMQFISETGYLPVTKQAFEEDIEQHLASLSDSRIKKMLTAVLSMYGSYDFFTAPTFPEFDSVSKNYEKTFKAAMLRAQQPGAEATSAAAMSQFISDLNER